MMAMLKSGCFLVARTAMTRTQKEVILTLPG